MPNIANVLKDEIKRVARKEINLTLTPLKVSNAALKKLVYEHKQRIAALEKENKRLSSLQEKIHGPVHDNSPKLKEDNFSITGRQVRSLRGRLGISQARLAQLLGVCDNIVGIWESKPGRLQIQRAEVREALSDLTEMKKLDVLEQAEQKKRVRKETAAASKPVKKPGPKKVSMTGKIIAIVQKSPKGISVDAIIKKIKVSKQQAWNILSTAKKEGKISSLGRGMYAPA